MPKKRPLWQFWDGAHFEKRTLYQLSYCVTPAILFFIQWSAVSFLKMYDQAKQTVLELGHIFYGTARDQYTPRKNTDTNSGK